MIPLSVANFWQQLVVQRRRNQKVKKRNIDITIAITDIVTTQTMNGGARGGGHMII
jgi:hypothetical protein